MNIQIVTKENLNTKFCIYKLIFPNNKIYIGQTIRTLKHRLSGHVSSAKRGLTTPIYNAIRKYKTFEVFILDKCDSIEQLNILECKYILELDSIVDNKKGYNSDYGGNNKKPSLESIEKGRLKRIGLVKSIETRLKLSKAHKGLKHKPISEEGRKNMSEAKKGKKASDETKLKMSISQKGRKTSEETKTKLSKSLKGLVKTEEQKLKISNSLREFYVTNTSKLKGIKKKTINNKLLKNQVLEIRSFLLDGKTIEELSIMYKVSKSTIQQIKSGKTWQSLGDFKIKGQASRLKQEDLLVLYNLFDQNTKVKDIQKVLSYCTATIAKQRKIWKIFKQNS